MAKVKPFTPPANKPHYVVPTSEDGQRHLLSCQVAPSLARRIQDICYEGRATGKWPWRTPSDVTRYLLVVGLEHFSKTIDYDDDVVRFHQVEHTVDGFSVNRKAAEALRDRITTEVSALISIGARDRATEVLHHLVPDILQLEDQVWREWLVTELRFKFHLFMDAEVRDSTFDVLRRMRPEQVLDKKKREAAELTRKKAQRRLGVMHKV